MNERYTANDFTNMHTALDFSKSDQYSLTIRLSSDGFSFYIVDPFGGGNAVFHTFVFTRLKSRLSQIEEWIYAHEQLLLPYRRTDFVVVSPQFTMVPNELYREEKKSDLLNFVCRNPEDKLLTNRLQRIPTTNLFSVDEAIYSFLMRSFAVNNVWHYATPIAEYFTERSRFGNYSKLYLHIEPGRVDFFCFERSRLKLQNTLAFNELKDAAYFTLHTWEKAGLHQTDDELYLCGNAELRNEISPLLKKYIQRVSPLNPPTDWYVASSGNEALPLDLMTIALCV